MIAALNRSVGTVLSRLHRWHAQPYEHPRCPLCQAETDRLLDGIVSLLMGGALVTEILQHPEATANLFPGLGHLFGDVLRAAEGE